MPIKRQRAMPSKDAVFEDSKPEGKLEIVAKPKKPIPAESSIAQVYGETPSRTEMLRFGNVAYECGDTPDDPLTIKDRFAALRTPYDPENTQEQAYRNRIRNRATAITAMCVICTGGRKGVTECADTQCPLWAYRFGSDPFYGRRKK